MVRPGESADLARLADPGLELRPLRGLVVLDEIHRLPDVFPLLRVLADRPRTPARFLVLGGASPDLLRQTSETLAGRVAFHELDGFSLREVDDLERLWLRGGFPLSWLARSMPASRRWRDGFIRTFLARDVPELGSLIPSTTLRRFWTMLAHWHGQLWNGAELGRAFGVSHTTVRRYRLRKSGQHAGRHRPGVAGEGPRGELVETPPTACGPVTPALSGNRSGPEVGVCVDTCVGARVGALTGAMPSARLKHRLAAGSLPPVPVPHS